MPLEKGRRAVLPQVRRPADGEKNGISEGDSRALRYGHVRAAVCFDFPPLSCGFFEFPQDMKKKHTETRTHDHAQLIADYE